MKTILTTGFGAMIFMYLITSMYNHTWDIMNYSKESVYWFGSASALGFFIGMMATVLDLDKKS